MAKKAKKSVASKKRPKRPAPRRRTRSVKEDLQAIQRARILIVASDPQTMSDMQDPDVVQFHEIEIALNASVAKTILSERHMDVLAMDTASADDEWVDQIREVREEFPSLPIIAIGDKKTKVIERRVKEAGANYYLARPLESYAVTRTIGRALVRAAKR